MSTFLLWLAQGFGAGRIPVGPGTFGSLAGLLWFAVLLVPRSPLVFVCGVILGTILSVFVCGQAERILHQKDPGSVVLDEIIAMPLCFAVWLAAAWKSTGRWPGPEFFFSETGWPMTVAVFVLFRICDIGKPWPVGKSQSLPGGWGVTLDDVLAALYVNVVLAVALWLKPAWFALRPAS